MNRFSLRWPESWPRGRACFAPSLLTFVIGWIFGVTEAGYGIISTCFLRTW